MVSYLKKEIKSKFALIIDFDSTIISLESLECIAELSLLNNKNKNNLIKKINDLTNLAMNGDISFPASLDQRLALMNISHNHIIDTVDYLKNKIDSSFKNNLDFIKEFIDDIYIVSGGFRSIIHPLMQSLLNIDWQIYANEFVMDINNNVIGVNKSNFLALSKGKVKTVNSLSIDKEIIVVGDGYTDYEIKKSGLAKYFLAYTRYVTHKNVINKSDFNCNSFDDVINFIKRKY